METTGGISVVNSNLAYQDIEVEIPQIKDEPVKWCSVSLSDVIARGKRLEASVFDVEAKQAWQTVINNRFGIKHVQKQINDLALQANQKRYKAYKLEQQALDIMDNEVIFAK